MTSSNGSGGGGGSSSSDRDRDRRAPSPVAQRDAPAGAYLGSMGDGTKLVSTGGGRASVVSESSGYDSGTGSFYDTKGGGNPVKRTVNLPNPAPHESRSDDIKTVPVANTPSTPKAPVTSGDAGSGSTPGGSGPGGKVPTDVTQKPPAGDTEGPEGTTVTGSPRSDFSPVLAGLVGLRRSNSPFLSNNFISLVGKAGGLGRKTSEAKRSLIGGA